MYGAIHSNIRAFISGFSQFECFCKTFLRIAEVAGYDAIVQVFPVVFEVVDFPVFVHVFPGEIVEDIQMGFEHVLRQGVAEFLIAVVEGDAKAVFGEVWQGLMYRECGKDQGVADFVVCAVPLAFQFVGVDAQAARAEGEVVFHDGIDFVRAGQYGEAAQFNGTVANRCPAGVGVEVALKVYEVLVNRCGVCRVFGKPQASDFVRMGENRAIHYFFEQVE